MRELWVWKHEEVIGGDSDNSDEYKRKNLPFNYQKTLSCHAVNRRPLVNLYRRNDKNNNIHRNKQGIDLLQTADPIVRLPSVILERKGNKQRRKVPLFLRKKMWRKYRGEKKTIKSFRVPVTLFEERIARKATCLTVNNMRHPVAAGKVKHNDDNTNYNQAFIIAVS